MKIYFFAITAVFRTIFATCTAALLLTNEKKHDFDTFNIAVFQTQKPYYHYLLQLN